MEIPALAPALRLDAIRPVVAEGPLFDVEKLLEVVLAPDSFVVRLVASAHVVGDALVDIMVKFP
jgi:hypothetical protein